MLVIREDSRVVAGEGFEPPKLSQMIYSHPPLAAWVTRLDEVVTTRHERRKPGPAEGSGVTLARIGPLGNLQQ